MKIRDVEYEEDKEAFPHDAYTLTDRPRGAAFRVLGWEREMDPFGGLEQVGRTGFIAVHMVGDNHVFLIQPSDLKPLAPGEFCNECGQIGCTHGNL